MEHSLKFYPVDNGDTTLLRLTDKTFILIDCKIREGEENSKGNKIFNVKADLLNCLLKRNNSPFLDLLVVTHPDEDHILGYEKNFYQGDPDNYGDSNRQKEEIIIDEIWITSMVFNNPTNDDSKSLKREAERRKKLWDENKPNKDYPGNRIRMIGYNVDDRYSDLPNSIPGEIINKINGKNIDNFEFFVHGPFKKHLITATAEKDQNFASIVMQARFKINKNDTDWKCLFLFGGDADHNIWAEVLNQSKSHNNGEKLKYDIFLSTHHCSWTFFNNVPYGDPEETKTPKDTSLELLDFKKCSAKIIASCKKIEDNNDNPPHYQAEVEYKKKLASESFFIELALTPKESEPEPVIFIVSDSGTSRKNYTESLDSTTKAALFSLAEKAPRPWCNE